jgi:bifunctional oligoribonuclease and PAP phosphatase NrnA
LPDSTALSIFHFFSSSVTNMEVEAEKAGEIYSKINDATNILIISHRNPDPDTVGCNIALRLFLERSGKRVTSACVDMLPKHFQAFPDYRDFIQEFDPKDYDLYIAVDCGSTDQISYIGIHPEIKKKEFINIDHHPHNDHLGTVNLVDDKSASTSIVLFKLFQIWDVKITPNIATWLLFGIYFDTGSFMHSNTTDEVYNIASELLKKGANKELIIKTLYKNQTYKKLCLWGRALDNLKKNKNDVAVTGVTPQDYLDCNAKKDDLSGLIDYMGSIKDVKYATLLSNDPESPQVRGSLRTRNNDVDVREIAKKLGGGGHKKASGFSVEGRLRKEMYWTIKKE